MGGSEFEHPLGMAIGGYRVEAAKGGNAVRAASIAVEHHTGQRVTLIAHEPAADERLGFAERFAEARLRCTRATHPGLPKLLDAGEDGGVFYAAVEHIAGRTVAERVRQEGRLPLAEVVRIVTAAAVALSEMHALGLVHGRLRADDITVADGGDVYVDGFDPVSLSLVPSDAQPADSRADTYALGCIAYDCLAGTIGIIDADEHAEGAPSPRIVHDIGRPEATQVGRVIAVATAGSRDRRYGRTLDFAHALREAALYVPPSALDGAGRIPPDRFGSEPDLRPPGAGTPDAPMVQVAARSVPEHTVRLDRPRDNDAMPAEPRPAATAAAAAPPPPPPQPAARAQPPQPEPVAPARRRPSRRRVIPVVVAIAACIGVVVAVLGHVAGGTGERKFRMPSSSMEPTLHCANPGPDCESDVADTIISRKSAQPIRRGEIVVFRTPQVAAERCSGGGGLFIKRVVGLPNELWEERDGYVFINGGKLLEPYVAAGHRDNRTLPPRRIPPGEVFMLGDNRTASCDSREWGSLPVGNIVGHATTVHRGSSTIRLALPAYGFQLSANGRVVAVFRAVPPPGHPLTTSDLERSRQIMVLRLKGLGVPDPNVRVQGADRIVVSLTGFQNPDEKAQFIGKTGELAIYDTQGDLTGPSLSAKGEVQELDNIRDLLLPVQARAARVGNQSFYLVAEKTKRVIAGPSPDRASLAGQLERLNRHAASGGARPAYRLLGVPRDTVVVTDRISASTSLYLLFRHTPKSASNPVPPITGNDIDAGQTQASVDTTTKKPIVEIGLTPSGSSKLRVMTRRMAERGSRLWRAAGSPKEHAKYNQLVSFTLDDILIDAAHVDFKKFPQGLGGPSIVISGGTMSTSGAKTLALALQTGALPVHFDLESLSGARELPKVVVVAKGRKHTLSGCTVATCAEVVVKITGFASGRHRVECHESRDPAGKAWATYATSDGVSTTCIYGGSGKVWVVVDGVRSNTLAW